ncbi:AAA family ATPase [Albibacterium sp.]|uniref:AAA family ATPase n=1 Tax=Albibacterium sp. TaxID=2952885 RepID=UPI002CA43748|nr:AAA family ATPase [Albibacterium sp.]HUH19384.1 AAA family ATPase [Albibacterium sp.]
MISKITKVNGFGVLDNFESKDAKPFNRYNLVYGWNGSGKTTLARLFRCLEMKSNHIEFSDCDFSIDFLDKTKVESKNYEHSFDIRVFNQDFANDNINLFDSQTKPIVFISKEKVEEKKELDRQKVLIKEKKADIIKMEEERDDLEKKIDELHKSSGKSIKDFLLGTTYANVTYNKNTSVSIWKTLPKDDQLEGLELSEAELSVEKSYTLVNSKKENISLSILPIDIDFEKISEVEREVAELIAVNITSKVIDRLKENPEISEWVSRGLILHQTTQSKNCEFCGNALQSERLDALQGHYNKEYAALQDRISNQISKLEKGIRSELAIVSHLLYDSLKLDYNNALETLNDKLKLVNARINEWIEQLKDKRDNPFVCFEINLIDATIFREFNEELNKLKKIIIEHNEISSSYAELAEKAKKKIESHFVSQLSVEHDLPGNEKSLNEIHGKIKKENEELGKINDVIKTIEDELKSDTLAIGEINTKLHKFLGRNDIALIRQDEGGYQLKRGKNIARNLSEGEKTAISLIYFFSKIQENDANISRQIIVLDDPISSFDSNHLFNAASLIKNQCLHASQLFVLTHNFWFFKQIRDWMSKTKDSANFYVVRKGVLSNAGSSLTKFHSEYQYVFNCVLSYQDLEEFDDSICFTMANSIRRLLEAFTSFKTPHSSGFIGALEIAEKKGLTAQQRDRIYYFLNKYSHLDRIESFDTTIEPLLEEGKNVVEDVLSLIKKLDEDHYASMLKVCNYEDKLIMN